jgi:hypothetical protein
MKSIWLSINVIVLVGALFAIANPGYSADPAEIKEKVSITPGKSLIVQFQQHGDVLRQPRIVDKADRSSPHIFFDLKKEDGMLILSIKSGCEKTVRLRALMRLKGDNRYIETSMLPLMPKLTGFESWQDPIEELVLFEFKTTNEKF